MATCHLVTLVTLVTDHLPARDGYQQEGSDLRVTSRTGRQQPSLVPEKTDIEIRVIGTDGVNTKVSTWFGFTEINLTIPG